MGRWMIGVVAGARCGIWEIRIGGDIPIFVGAKTN
jgi:hypothetical protein